MLELKIHANMRVQNFLIYTWQIPRRLLVGNGCSTYRPCMENWAFPVWWSNPRYAPLSRGFLVKMTNPVASRSTLLYISLCATTKLFLALCYRGTLNLGFKASLLSTTLVPFKFFVDRRCLRWVMGGMLGWRMQGVASSATYTVIWKYQFLGK